ncbi:MAG: LptF/LptG family permease [Pseudomonadota bacterium]
MGRTLSLYLAGRALRLFAMLTAGVLALVVMIDSVELLREEMHVLLGGVLPMLWMSLRRAVVVLETVLPFIMLLTAIFALIGLNRSRELVVIRAAGVSVWRFLTPLLVVALLVGAFAALLVDPFASWSQSSTEREAALARGSDIAPQVTLDEEARWSRQSAGADSLVIGHRGQTNEGRYLADVTIVRLAPNGAILERITAPRALYSDGRWILTNATVAREGEGAETSPQVVVSTDADEARLGAQAQSPDNLSLFELGEAAKIAESAGLSRAPYDQAFQTGLATPLFFLAMVIVASTISLKFGRFGRYDTMVLGGMIGGFLFYVLVEIFDGLGGAGTLPPIVAVWVPLIVVILGASTVLLHQEDG